MPRSQRTRGNSHLAPKWACGPRNSGISDRRSSIEIGSRPRGWCARSARARERFSAARAASHICSSGLLRLLKERIPDRHVAESAAVLQVFAEQHAAAGVGGGRDNERVIERERVV